MPRAGRFVAFAILPLFTLLLGWQLGMRYEQRIVERIEQEQEDRLGGSGATIEDPEREVDLTLFWQVWRILLGHYIEPADLETKPLLFGAIKGLVDGVGDPYTVFMTPEENEEFRDSLDGALEGIGAQLEMREDAIVVVAPVRGSPAEKAGLLPQDVLLSVNGESVEGKTLQEVIGTIRGPKGTSVTIAVAREGRTTPVTLTIVRDEIHVPSVEYEVKHADGKTIGFAAVNQFGTDTVSELRRALQELRRESLDGIILDLRFNGGGYLEGAVDMVSYFAKEGKVVTVVQRAGSPVQHYVSGKTIEPDLPMVVLINEGSASAAEIVAGALQDLGRATIIGMRSFGKGTVQEVIDLPLKTSLRVTTARWLTPNGRDLGKHGVDPDIVVERTEEDFAAKRDPQLDAALEFLATGRVVNVRTGTGAAAQ